MSVPGGEADMAWSCDRNELRELMIEWTKYHKFGSAERNRLADIYLFQKDGLGKVGIQKHLTIHRVCRRLGCILH